MRSSLIPEPPEEEKCRTWESAGDKKVLYIGPRLMATFVRGQWSVVRCLRFAPFAAKRKQRTTDHGPLPDLFDVLQQRRDGLLGVVEAQIAVLLRRVEAAAEKLAVGRVEVARVGHGVL